LSWVFASALGALPFVISGAIPSYIDAFYETVSGFTTTGASILRDVEALPRPLLLWRATTHWLGGMGIVVLLVAILPALGLSGIRVMEAEASGAFRRQNHSPHLKHCKDALAHLLRPYGH